ncbi:MAG: YfiR family protein [Rhodocyclaceae bacterium]|nr:YfiR family protein [Rhodocyclaceae bacterium]
MKRLLAALLSLMFVALATDRDALAQPTEYQLKAVFLLNFARYIEWPAGSLHEGEPIQLCVLGRDPFGAALEAIDGKQAQNRAVDVRMLVLPEQTEGCHVLFVSGSEERRVASLLRGLGQAPVLTVSDLDGFVEAGGAIGFATVDDRIRFDINAEALQRAGLRPSAQLMKIARHIVGLEGR